MPLKALLLVVNRRMMIAFLIINVRTSLNLLMMFRKPMKRSLKMSKKSKKVYQVSVAKSYLFSTKDKALRFASYSKGKEFCVFEMVVPASTRLDDKIVDVSIEVKDEQKSLKYV